MNRTVMIRTGLSWAVILALLLSWVGPWMPGVAAAPGDQLFTASGDLNPGELVEPTYPLFVTQKVVNLKMMVPDAVGDGTIDLTVTDGAGGTPFTGAIRDGETLWATFTLKSGDNAFTIENTSGLGGPTLTYQLWLYEVDVAPYDWAGVSQGAGTWRSHIQLGFATSGLYTFDLGALTGRYQFQLDSDYLLKTVEADTAVTYYVMAGTHDLYIQPDSAAASTSWTVDISGPGAATDTLPYAKAGGNLGGVGNDFASEWLPLNLSAGAPVNLQFTVTGAAADALDLHLYDSSSNTPFDSLTGVYGGETVWWTADLAPGVNRIELVADQANIGALAYDLTIVAQPSVPANWAGASLALANNSQARFTVGTAGLYDFAYGLGAGRYQFLIDDDYIQKTVEVTGTVRYYLAAGGHELTVVQDPAQARTDWSLAIASAGQVTDTLPYAKQGGNLGGINANNVFLQEWLPIKVAACGRTDVRLALTGDLDDGLMARLYQDGTPVYTSPMIYGGEVFWWNTELGDGINQIQLLAQAGNGDPLEYDLAVNAIPAPAHTWSGVAKGTGGNSEVELYVSTAGAYNVRLETADGFAYLLVDGATVAAAPPLENPGHDDDFDLALATGTHRFQVIQAAAYATTAWTATVSATTADAQIAHFSGDLAVGEEVAPQLPLLGAQAQEVNFRLATPAVIGGGQLDLTITDGDGGAAFAGTALDGEIVWGTATLTSGQNTFTLHNTGANPLTYDLTVYEIESTPYNWAGDSQGAGSWDSHVKLNLPQDAGYTFDYGVTAGRYQFVVDSQYVQKTVEVSGAVTYFVPAGEHVFKIVPDRSQAATSWTLDVTSAGAAADTLPYTKTGGQLWATGAQFNEEWLPLNLAGPTPTNWEFTLAGAPGDSADVYVYDGLTPGLIYTITNVSGGETVWWTTALPAGLSRIQIMANAGNAGDLGYDLVVYERPAIAAPTPTTWAGTSYGASANNTVASFQVDTAGLYDFDYGLTQGRYQFQIDSEAVIYKTVETTGTVRYYLGAGVHELIVIQDPAPASTSWSLGIAATGVAADQLPYAKAGGNLGGAANAFAMDLLPLNLTQASAANFKLTLAGDLGDGLVAYLYHGASPDQGGVPVYASPLVYGGETFWWSTDLAAGVNYIALIAGVADGNALSYELAVEALPTVAYAEPHTWSGVSKGTGGRSEIEVLAPVDGTYHVVLHIPHGFASMYIVNPAPTEQSHIEFDVPLDEGGHWFQVRQSPAYITTTWAATISLKSALAPQVLSVDPNVVTNTHSYTLTLAGANFQPGIIVELDSTALSPVVRLDASTLQVHLPAGLPAGTYTLTVTNPDSQTATRPDALTIVEPGPVIYKLFLPLVLRNP